MTTGPTPDAGGGDAPRPQDNGLLAERYVPLTDVDPAIGPVLLDALGRARIAAYLGETPARPSVRRLFVAAEERGDARTIVAAVIRAAGGTPPPLPAEQTAPRPDPLADMDTDAAFADLIADWHVDTLAAIRKAERSLSREDADWRARLEQPSAEPDELAWLDDLHYVPPVPPPLPRFSGPTLLAMVVLALSVVLLFFGAYLGLAYNIVLLLGVAGVLVSAGLLLTRLRDRRDEDDDGAVL